jgi:hypothetical protein
MSWTKHTVYACLSSLQDMAHTTNAFDTAGTGEATSKGNFMVYVAQCDFCGASFNFITRIVGGRDGVDRCRCQMSCSFLNTLRTQERKWGVADCWVARCVDLLFYHGEAPLPRIIRWYYGPWSICAPILKSGRIWRPNDRRKADGPLNEMCMLICEQMRITSASHELVTNVRQTS